MRRIAFLTNFGLSAVMIAVSLFCLAMPVLMPDSPDVAGAFLGGMFAFLTFAVWGSLEWRAYMRSQPDAERHAAFCSAVFGGVVFLSGITALLDILNDRPAPDGMKWTVSGLALVAAWFILSSAHRLRRIGTFGHELPPASEEEGAREREAMKTE